MKYKIGFDFWIKIKKLKNENFFQQNKKIYIYNYNVKDITDACML